MTGASGATRVHTRSLRALLAETIDYAGLFPPSALGMADAVAEFAEYSGGPASWALGRFVVPSGRLEELAEAASSQAPNADWPLSVLIGGDAEADSARLTIFAARGTALRIVATEGRAGSVEEVRRVCRLLPAIGERFVEIPVEGDTRPLLEAMREGSAAAKIRTGGITPDAFPAAADVARFLSTCRDVGVPFKATAGLHHPVRGEYSLTYAPDSVRGTMFGFLNVLVAAALSWHGAEDDAVLGALVERDATAFRFEDDGVSWGGHVVPTVVVLAARRHFARGLGSCSFREPLEGLAALGLA